MSIVQYTRTNDEWMVDNTLIEYCHLMQCQNAGVRPVPIIKEQQQLSNAGCGQWKMGGHYYSFTLDTQTRGELSGLTCIRNVSRPASVFAYVLSNQVISWLTKNEARSLTGWLQHPTASAQQITNYTPCLKKNAPTLESCSLNRHGLILIFFIKNSINTLLKIICIFNFGRMIGSYVARRLHAFLPLSQR